MSPTPLCGTIAVPWHWPRDPLPPVAAATSPPALLLVDRRDALDRWRPGFCDSLSPQEHQRMQRYRRPEDRDRFLIGRGVLRLLLGRILARPPGQLRLGQSSRGKPFLLADPAGADQPQALPRFNLSHSGDLLLFALHPCREVGVDLEQVREGIDWLPIARRCLAEDQRLRIERSPPRDRPAEFFRQWCRLEARLKLSGVGLAGMDPSGSGDGRAGKTILWDVQLPAGYRGAVAMEDPRAAGCCR